MLERHRKRRRLLIISTILLVLAVGAGGWLLWTQQLRPRLSAELSRNRFYTAVQPAVRQAVPDECGPVAAAVRSMQVETDPWSRYDWDAAVPEGAEQPDDFFADAVFLGDSLTDGLMLYSVIRPANVLAVKGVSVFSIGTKPVLPDPEGGEDMTLLEALEQDGSYGKIYVLLGVNELGEPSDSRFINAYGVLIDRLKASYPAADIYVQSMMPVNESKARSAGLAGTITNESIARRNALILQLCAEKEVFFLDLFTLMKDETGALPREETNDGVHLYIPGYQKWYAYLCSHAAAPPPLPGAPTGRLDLLYGIELLES